MWKLGLWNDRERRSRLLCISVMPGGSAGDPVGHEAEISVGHARVGARAVGVLGELVHAVVGPREYVNVDGFALRLEAGKRCESSFDGRFAVLLSQNSERKLDLPAR